MSGLASSRALVASVAVLLVVAVGAWLLLAAGGRSAPAAGNIDISFEPGPHGDRQLLEGSGLFRRAVKTVNAELKLPEDIHIRVVGDQPARPLALHDPRYEPRSRTIFFPWSFVDRSRDEIAPLLRGKDEREREEILAAAMQFALYHELAHGLIHVLDVPIVGNEEASADSLATIFAIASDAGGELVPLSAATLLRGPEGPRVETAADFAAAHNLAPERAYDAICLVYGSDPERHVDFVTGSGLSRSRLDTCRFEYQRQLRSWRRLLRDWLTDEGGLRPLP